MNQVKLEIVAEYLYESISDAIDPWLPDTGLVAPVHIPFIELKDFEISDWMTMALDLATKLEESDRIRTKDKKLRPLIERQATRDAVKYFRVRTEMSQHDMAVLSGVSRGTIQRITYCEHVGGIHVRKVLKFMEGYSE